MIRKRCHYITLFEILIVMAIIALISGLAAIGIDKALVTQRFENEAGAIVNDLRLAQELMMVLDADVHVKFSSDDNRKGIEYWLEMDTQIDESLQRLITKKKPVLTTIRGVFFEGDASDQQIEGMLDLKFLSKGAVMTKGVVRVSISGDDHPPKDALESFICLTGYPSPISLIGTREALELSCTDEIKEEQFNETVTQDTLSRLPDNLLEKPPTPAPQEETKTDENSSEKAPEDSSTPSPDNKRSRSRAKKPQEQPT